MKHVVIIGNGISGITAARNIRERSDLDITVISSETKYFFSRTALMYVYMGHMKQEHTKPYEDHFWEENKISLIHDSVEKVEVSNKKIMLSKSQPIQFDSLVIATGSNPKKLGVIGENLRGIQSLYSIQDLDLLEKNTHPYFAKSSEYRVRHAVIIGAGLIGIELAEMLHSRNISVCFIVKDEHIWSSGLSIQEAKLIEKHLEEHGITFRKQSQVSKFVGDDEGNVCAIELNSGEHIYAEFVGVTIGVEPNTQLTKGTEIEVKTGIVVDQYLRTSVDDIYAIGDCAELSVTSKGRNSIEPVWYTGRMMGEVVAETICGSPCVYEPGPWFNSAKFFGLEYQCYGSVSAAISQNRTEFFWQNKNSDKSVRILFDNSSMTFIGFSSIGIRWRHDLFNQWLSSETNVMLVIENLEKADFESEFSRRYTKEIVSAFKLQLDRQDI
jgi:NAD(P)H-nitrite reductase large subunit